MKLTRWPETELEYWLTIETLGSFLWRISNDSADACIQSASEKEKELKEAQQTMEKLVSELSRFGVIHPKECPTVQFSKEKPEAFKGRLWYWEWYNKMKESHAIEKFEGEIIELEEG
jgi:hypothetical protein